ncbi:MAG: glycosyltransferase family 1 protein [Gammaproteobacteria bacterium]|nr:glycosyltransferase family 1 protein [Gammaproteobacteria bacterium]
MHERRLREASELLAGGEREAAGAMFRDLVAQARRRHMKTLKCRANMRGIPEAFEVTIFDPPKLPMKGILMEVAEAVCYGLRDLGMDARITTSLEATGRRRILLGTGALPNAQELGCAAALPLQRGDTILYQLEQVEGPAHFLTSSVFPWFMTFAAWDYSRYNMQWFDLLGMDRITHVALGYVPQWTRIPGSKKDIDVLFYGRLTERRRLILDKLHRRGVKVAALVGVFGAERDSYIARSRIVLNVHHYQARIFEYPRVLYLLANGACVVSESGSDPDEAEFSAGVAFAPYDGLVSSCLNLLDSPRDRDRISEQGFRLVRSKPMSTSLKSVPDLIARPEGQSSMAE